jgi:hypothetical protein
MLRLPDLAPDAPRFRLSKEANAEIESACAQNPDLATCGVIGHSEEGRPILGVTMGHGPRRVSLVAGAHADEPVGPETLRTFIVEGLAQRGWGTEDGGMEALFERFTFEIIPHVNPDAEAVNRAWTERWEEQDDLGALGDFLRHRLREQPGRDVEFGYPVMRPENEAVSRFLFGYRPLALHLSLHGMAFSEGALLLAERHWAGDHPDRFDVLKSGFSDAARSADLRLHDHDRQGDKGFRYYGPGFQSTPEGAAMRAHFEAAGDDETARRFFLSSMEMARVTGYDREAGAVPLSLVTELPLFLLEAPHENRPGVPATYDRLREALPDLLAAAQAGDDLAPLAEPFQVRRLGVREAMRLQLRVIELGLEAAGARG